MATVSRTATADTSDKRLHIQADLEDPESVLTVFETVCKQLGHPSVVVYNGSLLGLFVAIVLMLTKTGSAARVSRCDPWPCVSKELNKRSTVRAATPSFLVPKFEESLKVGIRGTIMARVTKRFTLRMCHLFALRAPRAFFIDVPWRDECGACWLGTVRSFFA